jgi:ATP-dependent RNA circularization protein (DNA/RNA ligase family)
MIKFPSTPHLACLGSSSVRDDKVLTEQEKSDFLLYEVILEEKIDGANLGISFDDEGNIVLQNRGNIISEPYLGQWKDIERWLEARLDDLFDALGTNKILFGEWCYAIHSIEYKSLPDWFIAFDVYDKKENRFLSVKRRNEIVEKAGLNAIRQIARGVFSLDEIVAFMGKSAYGEGLVEGIYLRIDEGDWLKQRAKIVRTEFTQAIETHWSKMPLRLNGLRV